MIVLPPKNDDDGCEVRVLLAECRTPSFSSYTLADAITSMQLMDRVIFNRLANPGPFGAKGATTVADVVKARGQFAGFQNYPKFDASIANRIQAALNIANSTKDKRSSSFQDHFNAAIQIANDQSIADPSPGTLVAWRTAGSGSPGANFKLHTTLMGIAYFFIP